MARWGAAGAGRYEPNRLQYLSLAYYKMLLFIFSFNKSHMMHSVQHISAHYCPVLGLAALQSGRTLVCVGRVNSGLHIMSISDVNFAKGRWVPLMIPS